MIYLAAFFIPMLFLLIFEPSFINFAEKKRVYDKPSSRKIHTRLVPLWGGLGIWISVWAGLALLYFISDEVKLLLAANFSAVNGVFLGSLIILITGMADDRQAVSPTVKLLAQTIAVMMVLMYGVEITGFKIPFMNYVMFPRIVSIIITAIWMLAFTNVINLIDGVDGLACGISAIAAFTFSIVIIIEAAFGLLPGGSFFALLSLLLSGACLGFLYFNFPPAGVFLGDSGSLLLGFFLGIIAIQGMLKLTAAIALVIPIMVVALPIFDVVSAIIRRSRANVPIMRADSEHIHHKLLKGGWSSREVSLLMYNLTLILSIVAIMATIFSIKR
ncbi:undecaprenyl/decaprenyl-phosphate alpha-N-acetylglucosaminyl 1-phosphate transferase [bacterium]|nr:undecaprenyl/decaprenyl-phosphate alpha-N-acetylglucosaminyl 1-phosphate transferase [Candidatus Omnitrophota bacterium]MBU2528238.1 undecaprenyl/decaprenyl-phosphate alpha-N-acetylglucosaminyl 1-phosphate transferase [bacterium]MBU3929616.1 undecaprenyl/decaprenyl-phosphate alpha-N-acetylglucosaminyl 1-phosphate transferase [bacterium]MBU4122203.1 undecaprenyl/decaprenyl-phosphate alpha-N-acetylglucosaminyl 1-phosphate transferase [bacterium]